MDDRLSVENPVAEVEQFVNAPGMNTRRTKGTRAARGQEFRTPVRCLVLALVDRQN
ncbi:hypothetical protein ZHAS_00018781 [Anopheles sinensis]|uniref:Uncharacterized protein n=1 Tax=Anopheles sinensis TaxID=74873 RepID=A0A084WKJ2_ANOSI|nr:hypothetical protein ZHAS_00018781 [Anopheles sinensis]